MPAPFSSPFVTIGGRRTCPCSSMVCCRHPTLRQFFPLLPPAAYFSQQPLSCLRRLSANSGRKIHRRVSRFPATLWHGNRDTSSKPPRFIRHRRRFGGFPKNATLRFQDFLFSVQELLPKSRQNRESPFSYSRCRFIGWLKKLAALPWGTDRHSQCAHWLGNDATRNRMTRRCRLSAAIRGKLYPPEVINHFWQSICLRSSPHKYSPIRQFFTISSYFSGFVKFS